MPLPPGVSRKDFDSAIREFEGVVGKDWVFASEEDAAQYRDAYSIYMGEDEDPWASGGIAPTTVEQVQSIVHIANKYRIPIYAVSTGKNLSMGGSAPNYSGSFCVDLRRMNKILEIDEQSATCLVEPGVTYFDLYNYIQKNNLKLWIDCPDPGWGSVMGNALDHGQGHTTGDYRDHWAAHSGMEVVLPDGQLLRTGMGAMPNSTIWQRYQYGLGPSVDGLFNQSNMGIVTKMGFFLKPQPEAYMDVMVHVPRYEDLIPLVSTHSFLQNSNMATGKGHLHSSVYKRGPAFKNTASDNELKRILDGDTGPKKLQNWASQNNVPFWSYRIMFYGPEKVIEAEWEYAKDLFSKAIKGVRFQELSHLKFPLTNEQADDFEHNSPGRKTEIGIPSLNVFGIGTRNPRNPHNPYYGEIFYGAKIPRDGEVILNAINIFDKVFKEMNYPVRGYYGLPQLFSKRCYDMGYLLYINNDKEKNRHTREVYRALLDVAAEQGWSDYRLPLAFQKQAMDYMSFGDHAHRRTVEKIKDALDPNGIFANGRYNIWSKHLREEQS